MADIGYDIEHAAALLEDGELVAIPTETVYGLAANALDEQAVLRIFQVKNRPTFDPLIVHVPHESRVKEVAVLTPQAELLLDAFSPGPLTLLLEKRVHIPDLVTAGLPRVGVRIPAHPITRTLLNYLPFPLAAPSANPFGYISPTQPAHVEAQLGNKIAYILDGGSCEMGIESTIIGWESGLPTVWRKGALSIEQIEAVIGPVEVRDQSSSRPQAPGNVQKHYAPHTPFRLMPVEKILSEGKYSPAQVGALRFSTFHPDLPLEQQCVLSPNSDVNEAARHLFAAMRGLDALSFEVIASETVPEYGLGRAINDRLKRASVSV